MSRYLYPVILFLATIFFYRGYQLRSQRLLRGQQDNIKLETINAESQNNKCHIKKATFVHSYSNHKYKTVTVGSEFGRGWHTVETNIVPTSIVYSIGVGIDTAWDVKMLKEYGVAVYGYDPSAKATKVVEKNPILNDPINSFPYYFHQEGLISKDNEGNEGTSDDGSASKDGDGDVTTTKVTTKTLTQMMEMNQHDHIDILKLNIGGKELNIMEGWVKQNKEMNRKYAEYVPFNMFDQLLVAFHHIPLPFASSLSELKVYDRKVRNRMIDVLRGFEGMGYEIYYSSLNEELEDGEVSMIKKKGC